MKQLKKEEARSGSTPKCLIDYSCLSFRSSLGKKINYSLWSTSEILFILLMMKSQANALACVCDQSRREKENIRYSASKRQPHGCPLACRRRRRYSS